MKRKSPMKSILCLFSVWAFCFALSGPLFAQDPNAFIAVPHDPPSTDHWFGTTGQGQDVLAQTIAGARITLLVGFVVGIAVTFISAFVGTAAHVPLADEGGFVTRVLKKLWKRDQLMTLRAAVDIVDDAVGVGVLARENACPVGRAKRRGRE